MNERILKRRVSKIIIFETLTVATQVLLRKMVVTLERSMCEFGGFHHRRDQEVAGGFDRQLES